MVDGAEIVQIDDVLARHAEPVRQLALDGGLDPVLGPAHQHVRLDPHLSEQRRSVLSRLALLLAQPLDHGV